MTSVVIGIHGLANKPEAPVLEGWWHQAMLQGLEVNKGIRPGSINFASVYWADKMYNEPDSSPDVYRDADPRTLKRYDAGWLERLKDHVTQMGGNILDVVKPTLGMTRVADKVLEAKLPDLAKYYKLRKKRDELRGLLRTELIANKDKRIMVVAHSMGSIIAYDTLRLLGREDSSFKVDHFVTIGSPLGLPHVKLKIAEENNAVRTPSCVRKWTNYADRFDPVAFDPHLRDDFVANARGVRVEDDLVLNDWGGINHKSYGYLRTPEFSAALAAFI